MLVFYKTEKKIKKRNMKYRDPESMSKGQVEKKR